MVGFHRCSFTGSVFFVAPFRGLARPGCRLHSTVVATYLSGEQDGDSDTDFRARNASQRPVMAGWWTPATSWWNIGETLVKHMRLFQPVFFAFQGSLCGFLHHSLSRRSSLSLSLVLESPAQLFRSCWKITNSVRWFSQLQSSIYSGFPVAMFDYQRVVYNSIHIYIYV